MSSSAFIRPTGNRVAVIGAGAVGVNLALFLDAWGYKVDLIEHFDDILLGSPRMSLINHGDGFEYYKPGHRRTGEYCIEGSLTKAMIYPLDLLATDVCSANNPIRFLVADAAVKAGRISVDGFLSNAEYMRSHYKSKFRALRESPYIDERQAASLSVTSSNSFMRPLEREEYTDVQGVAAGAYGAGFGNNMPSYYALLKRAISNSNIQCHFGVKIEDVCKAGDQTYYVHSEGGEWRTSQVFLCNAHLIPKLAGRIHDAGETNEFSGTYYLNSMTFLRLPATSRAENLKAGKRINFTLMEEFGCMYACIVPATPSSDGLAGIYFPDPSGSQRAYHTCRSASSTQRPPEEWEAILQGQLSNTDEKVVATFKQACRLYPFLEGYAEISHSVCGTVFNVDAEDSEYGLDRRVRGLSPKAHALTSDGRVSAWTAPKWTNAELTALLALDHALAVSGLPALPKDERGGCGPTRLDVARIARRLPRVEDKPAANLVADYARRCGLQPENSRPNVFSKWTAE